MVAMFGQAPRVDQDVIDVDQNEAMEVLSEHLMHEMVMKKKLEAAGDVEGWMYPCWRASSMYSSMAFCSGSESG